jgi:hypothetical protein
MEQKNFSIANRSFESRGNFQKPIHRVKFMKVVALLNKTKTISVFAAL